MIVHKFYNIFVASTNIPCILPIYLSIINKDYWTTISLIIVSSASIISHLIENHKHGMSGIDNRISYQISYLWNRLDVAGSIITIIRFMYLYYNKYGLSCKVILNNKYNFFMMCIPFLFNLISEYDKYNPNFKIMYIITHSIWHIGIFISMYYFLDKWIY